MIEGTKAETQYAKAKDSISPRYQRDRPHFLLTASNFVSRCLFLWIWRLAFISRQVDPKHIDLELCEKDQSSTNGDLLGAAYKQATEEKKQHKTRAALFKAYGRKYALIGVWKIAWGIFTWLGAYWLLKKMVIFSSDYQKYRRGEAAEPNHLHGHAYALALLAASVLQSISIHQLLSRCSRVGAQIRSGLMMMVYRKSLRLSSARGVGGVGDIVNLLAIDCARIGDATTNFHYLWSAAVEVIAILVLSFVEIGISGFPALGIVVLLLPIQAYLGKATAETAAAFTNTTNTRVHIMSEVLTAIKLIKFYAWEQYFRKEVNALRDEEMRLLKRSFVVKSCNFAVVFAAPVLVALACLATYYYTLSEGEELTSIVVFTLLSVYNTLRYPLLMMPQAVKSANAAIISLERLERFLCLTEVNTQRVKLDEMAEEDRQAGDIIVDMKQASFQWSTPSAPTKDNFSIEKNNTTALHCLTLQVKRGEVIAVIGEVGNGKSSLVAALLGEMKKTSGFLKVRGRVSYVPQEAWLLNATVRDNILFGSPFDETKYRKVIEVCSLERDLTLFAAGDQEQVGERGVNLSGGQKQRISLARAVYHGGDVVVLDDPLSAVDQHVGSHIFEKCIKEYLHDQTVILVTHQLQYLARCDKVVVMAKGRIAEQGTFDELMSQESKLSKLVEVNAVSDEQQERDREQELLERENEWEEEYETLHTLREDPMATNAEAAYISSTRSTARRFFPPTFHLAAEEALSPRKEDQHSIKIPSPQRPHSPSHAIEMSELKGPRSPVSSSEYQAQYERTTAAIIERRNRTDVHRPSISVRSTSSLREVIDANIMSVYTQPDDDEELDSWDVQAPEAPAAKAEAPTGVDRSADRKMGLWTWQAYMSAATGAWWGWSIFGIFALVHGIRIVSDTWLSWWVPDKISQESWVYLAGYAGFCLAFSLGVFGRGMYFVWLASKKSIHMHASLFHSIMRAPMLFFNTTPMGRVLNVFAKHMNNVDEHFTDSLFQGLQYLPLSLGALLLVACIIPYMWAALLGVLLLTALFLKFALVAEDRFKALDATTKPPVYAHLTTSMDGLFSLRAFGAEERFDDIMKQRIDDNQRASLAFSSVQSWIALYMDFLSSLYIYATALLLVLCRDYSSVTSSNAGLALSNALQMLVFLQWTIRMMGDSHAYMASVQQVVYYSNQIPPEAPEIIENHRPPQDWPSRGELEWKNVMLRYTPFGVAVLKDVNFKVKAGESVGIVGRTGSGKSTLLVSLLRIVESAAGKIFIDGLDVSKIGLRDLRSSIAIIPQEPVLFVGTMRTNLDPFNKLEDEEIWSALDKVHLGDTIRDMPLGLNTEVIENGGNFSLGQRQLFCIARAILLKTKILVLDEATAAIDPATDQLIQKTIRENFAGVTVLAIAHRLDTIIDYDRVLFMDAGHVAEYGEPAELLENPDGYFYGLVAQTGPDSFAKLRASAIEAAKTRRMTTNSSKQIAHPDSIAVEIKETINKGQSPSLGRRRSVKIHFDD